MKNYIILLISLVLIVCAIIFSKFIEIKDNYNNILEYNAKYEQFTGKQILGIDIATIINQAVNDNEEALVKKDSNQKYIQDDENSIYVEVVITEFKKPLKYNMETLYNGGMSEFAKYYGEQYFECKKVEYNSIGKVKHLIFEQIIQNK